MTQRAQVSDNLEEWDGMGGGREVQEGGDILTPMADVWQKPTQYCKAVILQVKINFNLKAHTHTHTQATQGPLCFKNKSCKNGSEGGKNEH